MEPPKGYIYKITCTITGKVYIGQTTKTVASRYKKHAEKARAFTEETGKASCRHLYRAMKLHGIDNFVVETIEEIVYERVVLDALEIRHIAEHNSIEEGYNLLAGGSGGLHSEVSKQRISATIRRTRPDIIDKFRLRDESKGLPMYISYHAGPGPVGYIINGHRNCDKKSFTLKDYPTLEAAKEAAKSFLKKLDESDAPYDGSRNGDWTIPKGVSKIDNGYRVRINLPDGTRHTKAFCDQANDVTRNKEMAIAYLRSMQKYIGNPDECLDQLDETMT